MVDSGLLLRLLHRAHALEPTTDACLWLTVYLCGTGRSERSLVFAEEAARIDPLSGVAAMLPCWAKTFMGLRNEALPMTRQVAARYPDDAVTRFWCGQFAATMGADDEASAILREVTATDLWGTVAVLYCHALAGRAGDVQRLVRDDAVRGLGLVDDQFAWLLAQALTAVGAHDEAIWWLRHGAERGFVNGRFVREVDQMLAPLRGHPDMPDLLAYMDARAAAIARAVDADPGVAPLRSLTP